MLWPEGQTWLLDWFHVSQSSCFCLMSLDQSSHSLWPGCVFIHSTSNANILFMVAGNRGRGPIMDYNLDPMAKDGFLWMNFWSYLKLFPLMVCYFSLTFFFTIFIFSFKLFTFYFPINTICFRRPKANKACSGMKAITSTSVFTGSASQSLMSEEWVVGLLWYVLQWWRSQWLLTIPYVIKPEIYESIY